MLTLTLALTPNPNPRLREDFCNVGECHPRPPGQRLPQPERLCLAAYLPDAGARGGGGVHAVRHEAQQLLFLLAEGARQRGSKPRDAREGLGLKG